ncbi:MAG: J domain-containing protein [Parvularculaceae bacterium]
MTDYAYKPRLGYDIRVRPPHGEPEDRRVWAASHARYCDAVGCGRRAAVRVAKTPRSLHVKLWLCAQHAQEHNRNWNFFDGLSENEAEAARHANFYGERPTWSLSKNDRVRAATRARGYSNFQDTFGLFGEGGRRSSPLNPRSRNGRPLPRLQVQAFETLGLRITAAGPDIRRRYAELVRRFHPDANGGDRSTETQLSEVVRAHQILKKAGIC